MKIVEFDNVILEYRIVNKNDIINNMLENLKFSEDVKNKIFEEVIYRESIDNTVLGFGFAIPHSKSEYVDTSHIVYMKLKNEVLWDSDEEPVNNILLILVPKSNPERHIEILKDISTKIMKKDFRDKLNNSNDIKEIYELLNM